MRSDTELTIIATTGARNRETTWGEFLADNIDRLRSCDVLGIIEQAPGDGEALQRYGSREFYFDGFYVIKVTTGWAASNCRCCLERLRLLRATIDAYQTLLSIFREIEQPGDMPPAEVENLREIILQSATAHPCE